MGRLGRCSDKCERAKHVRFPAGLGRFSPLGVLLGGPLGVLLGRFGGVLGRLEAIFGVLESSWAVSEATWALPGASWGPLRLFWGPLGRGRRPGGPRDKPWQRSGILGISWSGSFRTIVPLYLLGLSGLHGPRGAQLRAKARWRIYMVGWAIIDVHTELLPCVSSSSSSSLPRPCARDLPRHSCGGCFWPLGLVPVGHRENARALAKTSAQIHLGWDAGVGVSGESADFGIICGPRGARNPRVLRRSERRRRRAIITARAFMRGCIAPLTQATRGSRASF